MIRDLTRELLAVDWRSSRREIVSRFPVSIRRGLYVLYFENDDHRHVHDKNKGFKRGGAGKRVIMAHGASLKPGKFEGGFIGRRWQDADHLHRTRGEAIGPTYVHCLRFALVLDLSAWTILACRKAEKELKKKVDAFIGGHERHLLPGTTRHGDWRHLSTRLRTAALAKAMRDSLAQTEAELVEPRAAEEVGRKSRKQSALQPPNRDDVFASLLGQLQRHPSAKDDPFLPGARKRSSVSFREKTIGGGHFAVSFNRFDLRVEYYMNDRARYMSLWKRRAEIDAGISKVIEWDPLIGTGNQRIQVLYPKSATAPTVKDQAEWAATTLRRLRVALRAIA